MFDSASPLDLFIHLSERSDAKDQPGSSLKSSGSYRIREYLTGRSGGSLYDAWVRMGCPDPDLPLDRKLLEAESMPSLRQYKQTANDDASLDLKVHLEPLDVRHIIITTGS